MLAVPSLGPKILSSGLDLSRVQLQPTRRWMYTLANVRGSRSVSQRQPCYFQQKC